MQPKYELLDVVRHKGDGSLWVVVERTLLYTSRHGQPTYHYRISWHEESQFWVNPFFSNLIKEQDMGRCSKCLSVEEGLLHLNEVVRKVARGISKRNSKRRENEERAL
jgi:hypothetical protein